MKIEYRAVYRGNQRQSTRRVYLNPKLDFCCTSMAEAWDECGAGLALDPDRLVVGFHHCVGWNDDDEFLDDVDGFRVCPWCAEPIGVIQVDMEDYRVKACAATLKRRGWRGELIYCSKNALPERAYCRVHEGR